MFDLEVYEEEYEGRQLLMQLAAEDEEEQMAQSGIEC